MDCLDNRESKSNSKKRETIDELYNDFMLPCHRLIRWIRKPITNNYFIIDDNLNRKVIVFIKDTEPFYDTFVVVGSHPRRVVTVIDAHGKRVRSSITHRCDDCNVPEADCGPTDMLRIVFNGKPRVVCGMCVKKNYNDKGMFSEMYNKEFYNNLNNERFATIRVINTCESGSGFSINDFVPKINATSNVFDLEFEEPIIVTHN